MTALSAPLSTDGTEAEPLSTTSQVEDDGETGGEGDPDLLLGAPEESSQEGETA